MGFKVFVDDNYHFMDPSERYELGDFPTLAEAIAASKQVVDEFLLSAFRPGMTAQALFDSYTSFGEDPFIVAAQVQEAKERFSAWNYARFRCAELCQAGPTH